MAEPQTVEKLKEAPAVTPVTKPVEEKTHQVKIENLTTKKLAVNAIQLSQYKVEDWTISPDAGVTKEDIMDPNYLGHVANRIQTGSKIRVYPKDNTYYAEFLVRSISNQCVVLAELMWVDFPSVLEDFDDGSPFKAVFSGPFDGYRVIRKSDGFVLRGGFQSMDDAISYLLEHKKSIRR